MEVAIDGERAALVKVDRWMSEAGQGRPRRHDAARRGHSRTASHLRAFVREFEGAEDDLMKPIDHTLADTQIGVGYGVTTLRICAISRSSGRLP